MYFVYVLVSVNRNYIYVGLTNNTQEELLNIKMAGIKRLNLCAFQHLVNRIFP